MGGQLQALLHADRGYLVAGLWLLVVAIILCAPVGLMWAAALVKRCQR